MIFLVGLFLGFILGVIFELLSAGMTKEQQGGCYSRPAPLGKPPTKRTISPEID